MEKKHLRSSLSPRGSATSSSFRINGNRKGGSVSSSPKRHQKTTPSYGRLSRDVEMLNRDARNHPPLLLPRRPSLSSSAAAASSSPSASTSAKTLRRTKPTKIVINSEGENEQTKQENPSPSAPCLPQPPPPPPPPPRASAKAAIMKLIKPPKTSSPEPTKREKQSASATHSPPPPPPPPPRASAKAAFTKLLKLAPKKKSEATSVEETVRSNSSLKQTTESKKEEMKKEKKDEKSIESAPETPATPAATYKRRTPATTASLPPPICTSEGRSSLTHAKARLQAIKELRRYSAPRAAKKEEPWAHADDEEDELPSEEEDEEEEEAATEKKSTKKPRKENESDLEAKQSADDGEYTDATALERRLSKKPPLRRSSVSRFLREIAGTVDRSPKRSDAARVKITRQFVQKSSPKKGTDHRPESKRDAYNAEDPKEEDSLVLISPPLSGSRPSTPKSHKSSQQPSSEQKVSVTTPRSVRSARLASSSSTTNQSKRAGNDHHDDEDDDAPNHLSDKRAALSKRRRVDRKRLSIASAPTNPSKRNLRSSANVELRGGAIASPRQTSRKEERKEDQAAARNTSAEDLKLHYETSDDEKQKSNASASISHSQSSISAPLLSDSSGPVALTKPSQMSLKFLMNVDDGPSPPSSPQIHSSVLVAFASDRSPSASNVPQGQMSSPFSSPMQRRATISPTFASATTLKRRSSRSALASSASGAFLDEDPVEIELHESMLQFILPRSAVDLRSSSSSVVETNAKEKETKTQQKSEPKTKKKAKERSEDSDYEQVNDDAQLHLSPAARKVVSPSVVPGFIICAVRKKDVPVRIALRKEHLREGWCHVCRGHPPVVVSCPKNPKHILCAPCVMRHFNHHFEELVEQTESHWPNGCPVCTKTCPCSVCRQENGYRFSQRDFAVVPKERQRPPNIIPIPTYEASQFTTEMFERIVVRDQTPVMLRNATTTFGSDLWSFDFLRKHYSNVPISVRYQLVGGEEGNTTYEILKDEKKTLSWFLENADKYDEEKDPDFQEELIVSNSKWRHRTQEDSAATKQVVVYAKDFPFSEISNEWKKDLPGKLPPFLEPHGPCDMFGSLPADVCPLTLMGYLGGANSRTPFHIDKVGTIAFNVLVMGTATKRWWLVHKDDTARLSMLVQTDGGNLYKDNHWVDPEKLKLAGLTVYEAHQQKGDLVIVPPMISHQVLNEGEGLSLALASNMIHHAALPLCWDAEKTNRARAYESIYRIKAVIYFGLVQLVQLAEKGDTSALEPDREKFADRLRTTLRVYENLLREEELGRYGITDCVPRDDPDEKGHQRVCDMCKADIFNTRICCSCEDQVRDAKQKEQAQQMKQKQHHEHDAYGNHPHSDQNNKNNNANKNGNADEDENDRTNSDSMKFECCLQCYPVWRNSHTNDRLPDSISKKKHKKDDNSNSNSNSNNTKAPLKLDHQIRVYARYKFEELRRWRDRAIEVLKKYPK